MFVLFVDRVVMDSHQFAHNNDHKRTSHDGQNRSNNYAPERIGDDGLEHARAHQIEQVQVARDENVNHQEQNSRLKTVQNSKLLQPLMIIVAMGIHASFAGLALGAISERSGFVGFLFAILFHKWAESLTIGISLTKAGFYGLKAYLLVFVFSLATPLGTVVGLIFSGINSQLKGLLLAISAGTFIYITCVEIISEEYQGKSNKLLKFVMTSFGIGLMILIWFIEQWFGGG